MNIEFLRSWLRCYIPCFFIFVVFGVIGWAFARSDSILTPAKRNSPWDVEEAIGLVLDFQDRHERWVASHKGRAPLSLSLIYPEKPFILAAWKVVGVHIVDSKRGLSMRIDLSRDGAYRINIARVDSYACWHISQDLLSEFRKRPSGAWHSSVAYNGRKISFSQPKLVVEREDEIMSLCETPFGYESDLAIEGGEAAR
jgi:hypothetical protein